MSSDPIRACGTATVVGMAAAAAIVGHRADAVPPASTATASCNALGIVRPAHEPRIQLRTNERREAVAVDIVGLDSTLVVAAQSARWPADAWAQAFDVRVADAGAALPSVAGRHTVAGHNLRFVPSYPFARGATYRVVLDLDRLRSSTGRATSTSVEGCARLLSLSIDTTFTVPRAHAERATEVTAVYPTASELPMNQLKLYVHFSAPMRTGEVAAHARIVDEADGRVVPDAFYSLEDELWDPSQTRLTLLFDPGRIKRGLRPNQEQGLPLREGHRYRLVIDAAWMDANGDTLRTGFEKRFAVIAPDRTSPRPATWRLSSPRAGTRDTLTIAFGEPMDEALLARLLTVRDADDHSLGGRPVVGRGEDRWHFVPAALWQPGRYMVDVGTELEDLAGNNLRRLFDTPLLDRTAPALVSGDRVSLAVTVSPRPRPLAAWLRVGAPDPQSADVITFAPDGLLLVGDSRGSAVFALSVPDSGTATSETIEVTDIDTKLAARLGTRPRDISIRDMAVHPVSRNVYLSVLRGRDAGATPVLVRVSAGGRMDVVSLAAIPFAKASLPNPPRAGVEIEGDPAWKWTISAMTVLNGRLYVAGMSNEEFSSTIRQLPIPFRGRVASTGIRMYHAHHLRYETESPITAFAAYTFFGRSFLVAAYSCTPIVMFPVDSLADGAKVTGKTIAELGGGNVVRDILPFDWDGKRYLAVSNRNRSLQLLNATALPSASPLDEHSPNPLSTALQGVGSWLSWGLEAGSVAQVGILHLADFDAGHALAVKRDIESGALNLRLLEKPLLYP